MIRVALLALGLAAAIPAAADTLVFEGRVAAAGQAVLSTRIDGVVAEVLFNGGDVVAEGQALIRLDPQDAQLAVAVAEAELAGATAKLEGAMREANRQEQLAARGISPDSVVGPARTTRAAAEASLRLAQARLDRARLDLERTVIRAPIAGLVSQPDVVVGQFLEAEAGPPLATIVALDPVLVAYETPYAQRLASLRSTGAQTVEDLLSRIRVTLVLPGEHRYAQAATPHAASPTVNPETGTVRVWAFFDNPEGLLRPGMVVTVQSDVQRATQ